MLGQNPTKKCDKPIVYMFQLLNNAKKNYTTTEREALAMVYAFHKYHHYLLGNKFFFNVDHMALLYLVKKAQVSGQITSWLLLFFKYDFLMAYKLEKSHSVADVLSHRPASNEPSGVPNQVIDAPLFLLQLTWLQEIHHYLQIGDFPISYTPKQKQKLTLRALPCMLQQGKLYKQGQD
jgi:hypothetical protein